MLNRIDVGGNPVNYIDPRGLWKYNGYCRYISGGAGAGAGVLRCNMWSECVDDERQFAEVVAMFGGATVGIPYSQTYFNIELEDGISWGKPDLNRLAGTAYFFTGGWSIFKGRSWFMLELGSARSDEFSGEQWGGDYSLDIFVGTSWIDGEVETKSCCDEVNDG